MRINSIFLSVDGEVNFKGQGYPSVFVRMQGCNLADSPCPYCDTGPALNPDSGTEMTIFQVRDAILRYIPKNMRRVPKVTITGGEPLLQKKELVQLLALLKPFELFISIETNGTLDFRKLRNSYGKELCLVVDYKLNGPRVPSSYYKTLHSQDWVKFVISNKEDYLQAVQALDRLDTRARVAFSPVMGGHLKPSDLLNWMLADLLFDVTLNVQLHKLISVD